MALPPPIAEPLHASPRRSSSNTAGSGEDQRGTIPPITCRFAHRNAKRSAPQRISLTASEWEGRIGRRWLNIAGIVVLVVGIVLLIGYSLRYLGPSGRFRWGSWRASRCSARVGSWSVSRPTVPLRERCSEADGHWAISPSMPPIT